MPTEFARQAAGVLRDGSHFQWYVIPLFALVVYVYAVEVQKKDWNVILAGLAFWGMDWFNEIWNSLVFHFTNYAPVWGTPGQSAYVILIGLNIEISFMFAIAGVVFVKTLPADRKFKILGLPNRWALAIGWSIFAVFVELLLNSIDALTWDYSWWNAKAPWLIVIFGYLHFYVVSFLVYDMRERKNQLLTLGIIYAVDILAILIFGVGMGWL